jgi:hypothetical protein
MEATSGGAVVQVVLLLLLATCGGAWGLNADGVLLMSFKNAVTSDPLAALSGWSYGNPDPCDWNGVACAGFPQPDAAAANVTSATAGTALAFNASLAAATVSRVISLVLPNAQLSGSLPPYLARLEHLRHLDLSGNSLNGSALPAALLNASELWVLSLAGNGVPGELPDAAYARGLQELNLSGNVLAGRLPAALCRLPSLAVLGLANNRLAGALAVGGLGALELVNLSNNRFNGSIPNDFAGARLRLLNVSSNELTCALPGDVSAVVPAKATVDLSRNNLTGAVPEEGALAAQTPAAYEGNPGLCGPPLTQPCSIPSSLSNPPNATDSPPAFAAIPKNPTSHSPSGGDDGRPPQAPRGQEKLRPAAIVAIVVGDIAGVGILFVLFLYAYHVRKKRREDDPAPLQPKSMRGIGDGVKTLDIFAGGKEEKASTSTGCCIGRRADGSDSSGCSVSSDCESDDDVKKRGSSLIGWSTPQDHGSNKHNPPPAPATLVTVDGDGELEMETLLKASAYILGATGSTILYKAVLADGSALAVRRIGESGGADKLKDFEAQVRAVARFRHPNILRLRGFYWGADEKLLIHDYAPNGSLATIAFSSKSPFPVLA